MPEQETVYLLASALSWLLWRFPNSCLAGWKMHAVAALAAASAAAAAAFEASATAVASRASTSVRGARFACIGRTMQDLEGKRHMGPGEEDASRQE